MRIIGSLIMLVVMIFSNGVYGSTDCTCNCCIAVAGLKDMWCYAGAAEFCANYYGQCLSQCSFANVLRSYFNHSLGSCCTTTPDPCEGVGYNMAEVRFGLQMFSFYFQEGIAEHDVLSAADLKDYICANQLPYCASASHTWVICEIYYSELIGPGINLVKIMDPFDGTMQDTYYETALAGNWRQDGRSFGCWEYTFVITGISSTAISDIQGYHAYKQIDSTRLEYVISSEADPYQYAAVYVSDNELGPAILVESLIDSATLEPYPYANVVYDTERYIGSSYYYYLDYDDMSKFDVKRNTGQYELKAATENPISYGTGRVCYDPPTEIIVSDYPNDFGMGLTIGWSLSEDDQYLDAYHIYRCDSSASEVSGYKYIGTVDNSNDTYNDFNISRTNYYKYMISSAHHGSNTNYINQNFGIFNDFSSDSGPFIKPINNIDSLSFCYYENSNLSCDTWCVCPGGDFDTCLVCLKIIGSDTLPTTDYPKEYIQFILSSETEVTFVDGDSINANEDTDSNGETILSLNRIGGCGSFDAKALIFGAFSSNGISFAIKSPDLNGDRYVNVSDNGIFGLSYNKILGQEGYNSYCDFNCDDNCNLSDFSFIAEHWLHGIPPSSNSSKLFASDAYTINLILDDKEEYIKVTVEIENRAPIKDLCIALDNSSKEIEFNNWEQDNNYYKTTAIVPAINRNQEILFFGTFGGDPLLPGKHVLGKLVYRKCNSNLLTMNNTTDSGMIKIISGQILDEKHNIYNIGDVNVINVKELIPKVDYLGSNYPNPFNPSTKIEYGIASNTHVLLKIYNVNGQLIKTLVDEVKLPGNYKAVWDGKNNNGKSVTSGVYFYKMKTEQYTETKKMVLLR